MKYFLIAGERSGDLHGSRLVKALLKKDSEAEIKGFGGDMMSKEGMKIIVHYKNISFMGIWEVIKNSFTIRKAMNTCIKSISRFQPDYLILIDFPGFNMRIAKFAHKIKIPVIYYISPKIWAWNKGRIKNIKAFVNRMFVILPFEVDFYKSLNYQVEYVGNPLIENINCYDFSTPLTVTNEFEKKVAFLPGSRHQEVKVAIAMIKKIADANPKILFLVAKVENLDQNLYQPIENIENIALYLDKTYDILKISDAAIVTSGTATLETAILKIPQVVVYKTLYFNYLIAKTVVKIKFISLVNLIANDWVVKELIQNDFEFDKVNEEMKKLLFDMAYRGKMLANYDKIIAKLGTQNASEVLVEKLLNSL